MPWARWPWQRCKARKPREDCTAYHGRCDLRKRHSGEHALERAFDIVRF